MRLRMHVSLLKHTFYMDIIPPNYVLLCLHYFNLTSLSILGTSSMPIRHVRLKFIVFTIVGAPPIGANVLSLNGY